MNIQKTIKGNIREKCHKPKNLTYRNPWFDGDCAGSKRCLSRSLNKYFKSTFKIEVELKII